MIFAYQRIGNLAPSASDLASVFQRAEAAHGEHEKRTGQRDANWADWYAEYMVAEGGRDEVADVKRLRRHRHRPTAPTFLTPIKSKILPAP